MSRPWRIALAVVAVLVVVNLALRFVGTLTGGTPGGPRSSSYATAPRGAAAYAELLGREGHPVDQVRGLPHSSPPSAAATVFLLDPPAVRTEDLEALRAFVRDGGRLVASGLSREAMRGLDSRAPTSAPGQSRVREDGLQIKTDGATVWRDEGLVAVRRVGNGRSSSSPTPRRSRTDSSDRRTTPPSVWRLPGRAAGRSSSSRPTTVTGREAGSRPCRSPGRCSSPASGCRRSSTWSPAAALRPARGGGKDSRAAAPPVRRLARRGHRPQQAPRRRRRSCAARGPRRHPPPRVAAAGRRRHVVRAAAKRLGLADEDAEALLRAPQTDAEVLALGRVAARIRQDQR